jgi:hypothetical protein
MKNIKTWPKDRVVAHVVLLVTSVLLVSSKLRHAHDQFVTPHSFVSADVATTARTFAKEGILHLHGIPVNNNPPVGAVDFYTHWPPLLPISLSVVFRLFGDSECSVHIFMLAIFAATATAMYALGRKWLGPKAGALTAFFWMTLPVVLQFNDLAAQQSLAILFAVLALVAFEAGTWLGSVLLLLAVISSWEAALIAPAMWLVSKRHSALYPRAKASAIATAAGLCSVAMLFLLGNRQTAVDSLQAAKFYMGLSDVYSHVHLSLPQIQLPLVEQIRLTLLNNVWMLGPLGLAAVVQFFVSRPIPLVQKFVPVAAPWIFWCIVMHNHTARHHFEFLIAGPVVALSLAWLATNGVTDQLRTATLRMAVLIALVLVQMGLLPHPNMSDGYDPAKLVAYGKAIREATPQGSIVLAPLVSAVPLYYSDRHIVRGLGTPEAVREALPEVRSAFPDSPVYIAVPPFLADEFEGKFPKSTVQGHGAEDQGVSRTADAVVFRVD